MGDHAEFKDHIEMLEYAERSGLDYTWAVNQFVREACAHVAARRGD